MLQNKKIIVGVSGSIAAYKSAVLARLLIKSGADVRIIMTPDSKEFITPLTLSALTKYPVLSDFVKNNTGEWNNHVELGLWADLIVIAPATANTIAKMANGLCDNLLLATYLSARCPVMIAPAMDLDMYAHPSTLNNLEKLKSYGHTVLNAPYGELASGLTGNGRMAEPEDIVAEIDRFFNSDQSFAGKKVLITAGPTLEPIDPVRFISNHSSGKMGYALAHAFAQKGAQVTLVSGPTSCKANHKHILLKSVITAKEMFDASMEAFSDADIAVLSAAVADYTPTNTSDKKIKKDGDSLHLLLTKTPDILKTLGSLKQPHQVLVGFALETDNELENARKKLHDKNADMIVLNSLRDEGAGFGSTHNKITILSKNGQIKEFGLKPKEQVADDILNEIKKYLNA